MTQQISNYHFNRPHSRLVKRLMRQFAKDQPEAVRQSLPTNERLLQANLRRLSHPSKKIRVYLLEPSNEEALVSLSTNDKPKVEALAQLGVTDMDAFLHKSTTD